MTVPILQYVRERVPPGSIPEGQLAIYDIVYELARRIAALEAARSAPAPKVLYEGEASVLRDGILLSTLEARIAMHGHKRVHIVVTAAEDDES